jgi:hypothetical protein
MLREAGAGEQAVDSTPAALAAAIVRLADRPPLARRAMGEVGKKWVAQEHARHVVAARLQGALSKLRPPGRFE